MSDKTSALGIVLVFLVSMAIGIFVLDWPVGKTLLIIGVPAGAILGALLVKMKGWNQPSPPSSQD